VNLYRIDGSTYFDVRRLTAAELAEIEASMDELHRFDTDQQALLIVRANFFELEAEVEAARELVAPGYSPGTEGLMRIRLQLNRRIGNYLAAVRSFLDQTAHTLSDRYGDDSAEVRAFEEATNVEYDAHAHYRFADQLRNYTQHYGFGLDHIKTSASRQDDGTKVGSIELFFYRDALLASGYRWKAIVSADLTAGPAQIDVLPVMAQLNDSVTHLAVKRIELESPKAMDALRKLLPIIGEVAKDGPGIPMLFEHDLRNTGSINMKEFPIQTIERIRAAIGA
jgi:hypothetical protein